MYEWIPRRTNERAQRAILLLFLAAALLFAVPYLIAGLPFRWVLQLFAIGMLTAAIFLVTRYVSKIFIYRVILCEDGTQDLTVTEANSGARGQITVCRVGLSNILSCRVLDEQKDARAREALSALKKKRRKIFDYCADLHPAQCILLSVREGGEELWLLLSYSPELVAALGGERTDTDHE